MTDDTRTNLRTAYDRKAADRDKTPQQEWKKAERLNFLNLLHEEGKQSLLELCAGPGHDSLFMQQQGLDVKAVDLSPAMVDLCRAKGIDAEVMDVADLAFADGSFDAVYAFNCLLHLPKAELPAVLREIDRVLVPGGLFYVGLFGGRDEEGVWADDAYEPQRFFAFYADEALRLTLAQVFNLVYFQRIVMEVPDDGLHFQSVILRKRTTI
jgi:SAM-dependent methyltransferase